MARKKRNPEDVEELSTVTRVILNDLKGHREINHDFRKRNHFQKPKRTTAQEETTDHSRWMPKSIPREMKLALRNAEKPRKKAKAQKKKVSVRKRQDSFEYVVQLNTGKTLQAKRVIIRGEKVILLNEEMEMAVLAKSVKWIRETRVRVLTLNR